MRSAVLAVAFALVVPSATTTRQWPTTPRPTTRKNATESNSTATNRTAERPPPPKQPPLRIPAAAIGAARGAATITAPPVSFSQFWTPVPVSDNELPIMSHTLTPKEKKQPSKPQPEVRVQPKVALQGRARLMFDVLNRATSTVSKKAEPPRVIMAQPFKPAGPGVLPSQVQEPQELQELKQMLPGHLWDKYGITAQARAALLRGEELDMWEG